MSEDDWSYCQAALVRHSRTFAIPISQLPPGLGPAITCAYLLCRIADTVEDTADWSTTQKEELLRLLLDVLDEDAPADRFTAAVAELRGGDPDERELLLGLGRVLRCFATCPPALASSSRRWISELVRGMGIYSRRAPGNDGVVCLESEADVSRYCYFVAGTIGRLLTDAFLTETGLEDARARLLREHAEAFAEGLQLVNILRDISVDLARGRCFVPRTALEREGMGPRDLVRPEFRDRAMRALSALFETARVRLRFALEYTLALPPSARAIRGFCAIPLWLAVRSLAACERDAKLLEPGYRVKLSRPEVAMWVTRCLAMAGDDRELRESFAGLATVPFPEESFGVSLQGR